MPGASEPFGYGRILDVINTYTATAGQPADTVSVRRPRSAYMNPVSSIPTRSSMDVIGKSKRCGNDFVVTFVMTKEQYETLHGLFNYAPIASIMRDRGIIEAESVRNIMRLPSDCVSRYTLFSELRRGN